MCGEQRNLQRLSKQSKGSPPRVRGTVHLAVARSAFARITPACAGNSHRRCLGTGCRQDHPRVCGEQAPFASSLSRIWGSPPRVRGTAAYCMVTPGVMGITPACAGNRGFRHLYRRQIRDHPRVCGEQPKNIAKIKPLQGSPPRVRGTECQRYPVIRQERITPACAGNSLDSPP